MVYYVNAVLDTWKILPLGLRLALNCLQGFQLLQGSSTPPWPGGSLDNGEESFEYILGQSAAIYCSNEILEVYMLGLKPYTTFSLT